MTPLSEQSEDAQQVAAPNGSGAVVCGLGASWLTVGALGRSTKNFQTENQTNRVNCKMFLPSYNEVFI